VYRRGAIVELPPAVTFTPAPLNPPPSVASAEEIARGRALYDANCVLCHDDPGNAGGLFRRGLFPDLAYSPALASPEAFAAIVIDGARAANGMASYAGILDAAGADAIRSYLIREANDSLPANAPR
jgi:mono/diheme cytochrome c family protein